MSTTSTVLGVGVVVAATAGTIALYRRGRAQTETTAQRGGLLDTLKVGAVSLWTDLTKGRPSSGGAVSTTASTPTEASREPRRTLTARLNSKRMLSLKGPRWTETARDVRAQGRFARSN